MPLSASDSPPGSVSAEDVVPNFREDERVQARYATLLERRVKTQFTDHEHSIRRHAAAKRDELRDESRRAHAECDARSAVAEAARAAYAALYPQFVRKTRLIEPPALDNLRSMGKAARLHRAADDARRAADHAASDVRRIEHNEAQLEIELGKALERAPATSRDVTTSATWLDEIHAEDDLAEAKRASDAVVAERAEYARRLDAGTVSADERRLRAFAFEDVKHITPAFDALIFWRIDRFGDHAYFIMRDTRRRLFALPYDRRLEPLLDGAYDRVTSGSEFSVRRARRENSPLAMTLLEHFMKCSSDAEAAQIAYREHQEWIRAKRILPPAGAADDVEAAVIEALAAVAAEKRG